MRLIFSAKIICPLDQILEPKVKQVYILYDIKGRIKLLKKEKKSANNNFSKLIARLALARRTHGMYVRK